MGTFVMLLQVLLLWFTIFVHVENGNEVSVSLSPPMFATTYKIDLTETPEIVKIICSILYETVRSSLNDNNFMQEVTFKLASLYGITSDRISEVTITPDSKGRAVINFKLSTGGDKYRTIQLALDYFDRTQKNNTQINVKNIEFSPVIQSCSWTDGGCPKDDECIERCEQNLYPLLVLLVIPVAIVVAIVLLWYFKYRTPKEKSRIDLTELGYVENRSKFGETLASRKGTMSGISMADNGVRNEVYSVMGQKYGFSIDNADFSKDEQEEGHY